MISVTKWFSFFMSGVLLGALTMLPACSPKTNQKDCGYLQNVYGERISWKGNIPIQMDIDPSVPPELREGLYSAASRWNAIAGRELIRMNIALEPSQAFRDGRSVIYFSKDWDAGKDSEQGRTSVYWVGDQMQEADIKINNFKFSFYWKNAFVQSITGHQRMDRAVSLESLIVHELGHVLGLKHRDQQGSVMETYLSARTERVDLSSMDRESLSCEYN